MIIRDFTPADYPALVDIHNSQQIVWPEWPRTPAAWAAADQNRNPKCKFRRWIAEVDGKAVGFASYGQSSSDYHPQRFYVSAEIYPATRC